MQQIASFLPKLYKVVQWNLVTRESIKVATLPGNRMSVLLHKAIQVNKYSDDWEVAPCPNPS